MATEGLRGAETAHQEDGVATGSVRHPTGVGALNEAGYIVRFARDPADLERVLRLRFEVFNRELGEGLQESWRTGLDRDSFDAACHHLMLIHAASEELVGTYRMQTAEMARSGQGFYTEQEYDLATVPESVLTRTVELGRACILKEHRSGHALYALWRGLALYMTWSQKRYLIGCCSLTSQEPREGQEMLRYLEAKGYTSPVFQVETRPAYACTAEDPARLPENPALKVPTLFGTYLRYGAVVCSPPALDREFGTIDFLICLDLDGLDARVRSLFFASFGAALDREPQ